MNRIFLLLMLSAVTLGVGLVAPTMTTEPRLAIYGGDYTEVMGILFPEEFRTASFSIIDGVGLMWDQGSRGIAALIFGFSIIFPVMKILVLWYAAAQISQEKAPGKLLHFVEKAGKFSMIDVFVISVLIVTVKGLPGGSAIHAEWGLYVFAVSVIASIVAGFMIGKRAHYMVEKSDVVF